MRDRLIRVAIARGASPEFAAAIADQAIAHGDAAVAQYLAGTYGPLSYGRGTPESEIGQQQQDATDTERRERIRELDERSRTSPHALTPAEFRELRREEYVQLYGSVPPDYEQLTPEQIQHRINQHKLGNPLPEATQPLRPDQRPAPGTPTLAPAPTTPPGTPTLPGATTGDPVQAAIDEVVRQFQEQDAGSRQQDEIHRQLQIALQERGLSIDAANTAIRALETASGGNPFLTSLLLAGDEDEVPISPRVGAILRGGGVGVTGGVGGSPLTLRPTDVNQRLIRDLLRNTGANQFNVLNQNPLDLQQFNALLQTAGFDPRATFQGIQAGLPRETRLGSVLFRQ